MVAPLVRALSVLMDHVVLGVALLVVVVVDVLCCWSHSQLLLLLFSQFTAFSGCSEMGFGP